MADRKRPAPPSETDPATPDPKRMRQSAPPSAGAYMDTGPERSTRIGPGAAANLATAATPQRAVPTPNRPSGQDSQNLMPKPFSPLGAAGAGRRTSATPEALPTSPTRRLMPTVPDVSGSDDELLGDTQTPPPPQQQQQQQPARSLNAPVHQMRDFLDQVVAMSDVDNIGGTAGNVMAELHDKGINALGSVDSALEGRRVLMIGNNGTGKSFIINLILMLTLMDPVEYGQQDDSSKRLEAEVDLNLDPNIMVGGGPQRAPHDAKDAAGLRQARNAADADANSLLGRLRAYCAGHALGAGGVDFFTPVATAESMVSTTPVAITFRFGRTWHFAAEFMSQDSARNHIKSFLISEVLMLEYQRLRDRAARDELSANPLYKFGKLCFERLTTPMFRARMQDCNFALPEDGVIELCDEARRLCGKTRVVAGRGRHLHSDRLFVKERLRHQLGLSREQEPSPCEQTLLKRVVCFAPCLVLSSGAELTDSPGTEENNALKHHALLAAIDNHDIIVAVCPRNIEAQRELYQLLEYKVVPRLTQDCARSRLVVMHYPEPNDPKHHYECRNKILSGTFDWTSYDESDNATRTEIKAMIARDCAWPGSGPTRSADQIFRDSVVVFTALPTLFASLLLNERKCNELEQDKPGYLEKIFKRTGGQTLLGLVDWISNDHCKLQLAVIKETLSRALTALRMAPPQKMTATTRTKVEVTMFNKPLRTALETSTPICIARLNNALDAAVGGAHQAGEAQKLGRALARCQPERLVQFLNPELTGQHPEADLFTPTFGWLTDNSVVNRVSAILQNVVDETTTVLVEALSRSLEAEFVSASPEQRRSFLEPSTRSLIKEFVENSLLDTKRGKYKKWSTNEGIRVLNDCCREAMKRTLQSLDATTGELPSRDTLLAQTEQLFAQLSAMAVANIKSYLDQRVADGLKKAKGLWLKPTGNKKGGPLYMSRICPRFAGHIAMPAPEQQQQQQQEQQHQQLLQQFEPQILAMQRQLEELESAFLAVQSPDSNMALGELGARVMPQIKLLALRSAAGIDAPMDLWTGDREPCPSPATLEVEERPHRNLSETLQGIPGLLQDRLAHLGLAIDDSVPEDNHSLFYAMARCFHRFGDYTLPMAMFYRKFLCSVAIIQYSERNPSMSLGMPMEDFVYHTADNPNTDQLQPGDSECKMVRLIPLVKPVSVYLWTLDSGKPFVVKTPESASCIHLAVVRAASDPSRFVFKAVLPAASFDDD